MFSVEIHKKKFYDFAINDILAVLVTALVIVFGLYSQTCSLNIVVNMLVISVILFIIGTFTHWYLGIPTKFGSIIGLNDYQSVVNYRNNVNYGVLPVAKDVTMWSH